MNCKTCKEPLDASWDECPACGTAIQKHKSLNSKEEKDGKPTTLQIKIVTLPPGFNLYVNNVLAGTTPISLQIASGLHNLNLAKAGRVFNETIMVAEGRPSEFTFEMEEENGFIQNDKNLNIEMILVRYGTFTMGATPEQGDETGSNEEPPHKVILSDYYIGKYLVTQKQWESVMGRNPSFYKGDDRPVEDVSWDDAQSFIRKLNSLTGKNYRLPTEAEWEYAARGGNKSSGYRFSGSDNLNEVGWFGENNGSETQAVGQKKPNELGIYDMSGNVYEWCSDWYDEDYYKSSPERNPQGPFSGTERVNRGGGCSYSTYFCRVAARSFNQVNIPRYGKPGYSFRMLGFRLAEARLLKETRDSPSEYIFEMEKESGFIETIQNLNIEMVLVVSGSFIMGANPEQRDEAGSDEEPPHRVVLSDFYMGKHPVTQKQWEVVMGENPGRFKDDDRPVENVSWDDAQEFIRNLNSLTDKNYRLPTEAEWEYASRGGNKSRGCTFSGSDNLNDVGWFADNSGSETQPVGRKKPNELGIHDMCGNVWEWCKDWYENDYFKSSPEYNPQGPYMGSYRVIRGGSWYNQAKKCRVTSRSYDSPDDHGDYLGFRLVLSR